MLSDMLYDLAIRELSERTDPAKEKRNEAARAVQVPDQTETQDKDDQADLAGR
jgi:hypothetical protein